MATASREPPPPRRGGLSREAEAEEDGPTVCRADNHPVGDPAPGSRQHGMEPRAPGGVPASAVGGHSRRRSRSRSRRSRLAGCNHAPLVTPGGDRSLSTARRRTSRPAGPRSRRSPGRASGSPAPSSAPDPARSALPPPSPAPARAGTPRGVGTAGRRMRAPESPGVKSGTAGMGGLAASFRGRGGSVPEKGIIGMDASPHAVRDARPRGAQPGGLDLRAETQPCRDEATSRPPAITY